MKIIAFDPGGTTGVAFRNTNLETSDIELSQETGLVPIWRMLSRVKPDAVVYERFLYQRRDKVDLTPVEVIGVIKLWCILNNKRAYEQTPAQAKNLITDDKLKKSGLWKPSLKHAMDAQRHLLYHLIVTKGDRSWIEAWRPS